MATDVGRVGDADQALVASDGAATHLPPSGFDPSREAATILPRLGKAQRRVIMSLTEDWGEAACHKTAKRMFYGVAGQHRPVVFHKHRTDNCWCLSDLGMALKAAIAMEAASAGETEGLDGNRDSAGLKGIAQTQSDEGMQ